MKPSVAIPVFIVECMVTKGIVEVHLGGISMNAEETTLPKPLGQPPSVSTMVEAITPRTFFPPSFVGQPLS
jgi:hypothetical protein